MTCLTSGTNNTTYTFANFFKRIFFLALTNQLQVDSSLFSQWIIFYLLQPNEVKIVNQIFLTKLMT